MTLRPAPPLPLNTVYEAEPGVPWRVADGVQCVLCPNPGPFTLTGTNTYLVGERELVVIDPGPDDDVHLAALVAAIADRPVVNILTTHTHADHSPLARKLAELTGAPIWGCAPHPAPKLVLPPEEPEPAAEASDPAKPPPPKEHGDMEHRPARVLVDGDRLDVDGAVLEAVFTPGHIGNHVCYALGDVVFTGDHIMGWSTSVISPTDGDLGDFMASCDRLLSRPDRRYAPAHGAPVDDPHELVRAFMAHRRFRDSQILEVLDDGRITIAELASRIYVGLDERLVKASRGVMLSHLLRLESTGLVAADGELTDRATRFWHAGC